MARTAVIVIGGGPPDRRVRNHLPDDATVIAADSGFDHAVSLGLPVELLVGDLDSISAEGREQAISAGVTILRDRPDKDFTDTELGIEAALARGADHIIVVTGGPDPGDSRLDHELGTLLALARPGLSAVEVEAWWGPTHLRVAHGPADLELTAPAGSLLSLLPVHGPAEGVTTTGLRFPLRDETLPAGSSRGVSNELTTTSASVALVAGTLLIVQPELLGGLQ